MNRTVFLIDGFNLYHSVTAASQDLGGATTKWLNIRRLCESYMHLVGSGAQLEDIFYFSALAKHLEASKPDVTQRHKDFIKCLEDTGIRVDLSQFKRKTIHCRNCGNDIIRHEEKETDVKLAIKLLEVFHTNSCDTAVLVTGDTDIAPAVRTAQRLFPDKTVVFGFPYKRKNKELAQIVTRSFLIREDQYTRHQFADPHVLQDGTPIRKPPKW